MEAITGRTGRGLHLLGRVVGAAIAGFQAVDLHGLLQFVAEATGGVVATALGVAVQDERVLPVNLAVKLT